MKKAFSLIELSIVILIIGILIAGVTQSSRMVRDSRLKTAQTLTNSSPVSGIKGLVAWYETTLDGNIVGATNSINPEDAEAVSDWYDINPQLTAANRVNVSQATGTARPLYEVDGIGGLPTLNFVSTDYLFNNTTVPLAAGDDDMTFVIVWQSNATNQSQTLFSQGPATTSNSQLSEGMVANNTGTYGIGGGHSNAAYTPYSYSAVTPYVSLGKVDHNAAPSSTLYTNSLTPTTGTPGTVPTGVTLSAAEFVIGVRAGDRTTPYTGFISELIIFDRLLKAEECRDIVSYLGKKYGIKISN